MVFEPSVGPRCVTTVAAHVENSVALHKLTFGEFHKCVVLLRIFALESSYSGECPAGSALGLIRDGIDDTLDGPVDGAHAGIGSLEVFNLLIKFSIIAHNVTGELLLFLLSPSGHEVVADSGSLTIGVVDLVHLLVELGEDVVTEVEFFDSSIAEIEVSYVLHELLHHI